METPSATLKDLQVAVAMAEYKKQDRNHSFCTSLNGLSGHVDNNTLFYWGGEGLCNVRANARFLLLVPQFSDQIN